VNNYMSTDEIDDAPPADLDAPVESVVAAEKPKQGLTRSQEIEEAIMMRRGTIDSLMCAPGLDAERGLATFKMVTRRGIAASIRPAVVWDADSFEYEEGTSPFIRHRKEPGGKKLIHAYAVAHFSNSAVPPQFVVLDEFEIERIRAVSRSSGGGSPWARWPEAMWMKSAVRRLCKYLPSDSVLSEAVQAASELDGLEGTGAFDPSRMRHTKNTAAPRDEIDAVLEGGE